MRHNTHPLSRRPKYRSRDEAGEVRKALTELQRMTGQRLYAQYCMSKDAGLLARLQKITGRRGLSDIAYMLRPSATQAARLRARMV